jgi:hypothetical protein
MKTVIFGASEGQIYINMDDGGYSQVDAAGILFAENDVTDSLIDLGANPTDNFYNSSSIDFCEEEGFEAGEAAEIVEKAIDYLQKTLA